MPAVIPRVISHNKIGYNNNNNNNNQAASEQLMHVFEYFAVYNYIHYDNNLARTS